MKTTETFKNLKIFTTKKSKQKIETLLMKKI